MNTSAEAAWTRGEQVDAMAQLSSADLDDLGNLFEFGDIDLNNITNVDPSTFGENVRASQPPSHPTTPFQELSASMSLPGTAAHDFGNDMQYGIHAADQARSQAGRPNYLSREDSQGHMGSPYPPEIYQAAVRQPYQSSSHPHQFTYQAQTSYPAGHHVPPTPNSFEMHGMQQHPQMDLQQRAILEQRFQLRKDDATAYTPMVSPAGTPQFNVPSEFTIPGAYFSPLTSPMLHAQVNTSQHLQGYYTNPSTAPSSSVPSPADHNTDVEMHGTDMTLPEATMMQQRKPRRKPATPRSLATTRVKQSPIQKGQKRKSSTLSSVVPTSSAEALIIEARKSGTLAPNSAGSRTSFHGSSDDGSISPEPLSEALMGPPPRPGTGVTPSPSLNAQVYSSGANGTSESAATPKSILSMRGMQPAGSTSSVGASGLADLALEDLELPEAANPGAAKPSNAQLEPRESSSADVSTPRLSARKTPKLGPTSTPSSTRPSSMRPMSASNSPLVVGSPMPGSTPGGILKDRKDVRNGRNAKKRGSMSASGSTLVSPALRPRISPSIKPLLPEGTTLHSPTHALLLASKSNYQNLLEGNHLPGVNYPDSLSTGLTSKRTSHKVAEQGRRNRINEALKEMQALLPKSSKPGRESGGNDSSPNAEDVGDGEGKDGKNDNSKSNSSKAATVESANEYIRKLQRENAELQKSYADMKRRLDTQTPNEGSTNSDESISEGVEAVPMADVDPAS